MFTQLSNTERIKTTIKWFFWLTKKLIAPLFGREIRFVLLKPALLSNQVIYDKKNKKIIRVKIRDLVDFDVIGDIFVHNVYGLENLVRERDLKNTYLDIINSGKTPLIIDCGANSGMATRYFTETYNQSHIVAIEPDLSNMNLAKVNNQGANVSYLLAGVGSADSRANIQDPGHGNWSYRVETSANGNVEIISINTLLKAYEVDKYVPFIIKIDIEGFEDNLFERDTEWIDLFPILIIELHDWMLPGQGNSNNFLREISKRNRDFLFSGENVFSISNKNLEFEAVDN